MTSTDRHVAAGACPDNVDVVAILWLARYDPFEDNAEAADGLWDYSGAVLKADSVQALVNYLGHAHADVRAAAASALASALEVMTAGPSAACTV